jgi:hypothetical protein
MHMLSRQYFADIAHYTGYGPSWEIFYEMSTAEPLFFLLYCCAVPAWVTRADMPLKRCTFLALHCPTCYYQGEDMDGMRLITGKEE